MPSLSASQRLTVCLTAYGRFTDGCTESRLCHRRRLPSEFNDAWQGGELYNTCTGRVYPSSRTIHPAERDVRSFISKQNRKTQPADCVFLR